MRTATPRAFLLDVFGTVVDWRTSVARALRTAFEPRGVNLCWEDLADNWRSRYEPSMETVRSGGRDFVPLDVLHRENLDSMIAEVPELATVQRGDHALTESDLAGLSRCWHRLEPWPDSPGGLAALAAVGIVAAHSNGNVALMINLARYAGLRWDAVLGAEVVRCYKPDPQSYLRACEMLDLEPERVMMVAAHRRDLESARSQGLLTGYVHRPDEYGSGTGGAFEPESQWDVETTSLRELARVVAGVPEFPTGASRR